MTGAVTERAPLRRMRPSDRDALLALWERSVRATHGFLVEDDIAFYRPLVAEYLAGDTLELWVVADEADQPMGFVALSPGAIDALFLDPAQRGKGHGRRLVAHAQDVLGGPLAVDVNEQNAAARGFYESLGFVVIGRSSHDGLGRPHPLLHMRREAARRVE